MNKVSDLCEITKQAVGHEEMDKIEALLDELYELDEIERSEEPKLSRADKMRAASSKAQRAAVRDSQDIGRPPEGLADPERRRQSDESLLFHLSAYYPSTFNREFSPDHKRIIGQIQATLEEGGLKAVALMRGAGKSSILLRAVLWAVLTRRRRFVSLISATAKSARKLMGTLKKIILNTTKLQADYAAELHCFISLGGRSTLAAGQHVNGAKTNVVWEANMIASGYIEGVASSEFVISTVSLLGDVRGQHYVTTTGETIRPDCVLLDDPQTKASAKSKPGTRTRMEVVNGDVLKMVGGDQQMAGFAAVTIIRRGDLADQLVDRSISKHWRGEKVPCVKEFPKDMGLWAEFEELYDFELSEDLPHTKSKKFVADNFEKMHEGSSLFWMDNYDRRNEVSALHRAMIVRAQDLDAFNAECQLSPTVAGGDESQLFDLKADEIARRISPAKRHEIPEGVEVLTAFIDTQKDFLPYVVMGFTMTGRCYVIDYSAYPDQQKTYYGKQSLTRTLSDQFGEMALGDLVASGLDALVEDLMTAEYFLKDYGSVGDKEKGESTFSIDKLGIDVGFKLVANEVRTFCRESPHRARIHPQQGRFIGPDSQHWQKLASGKVRRSRGINVAFKDPPKGTRGLAELHVDVNHWKCQAAEGLTVPPTSRKAILLYDDEPANHMMLGEHCEAEQPFQMKGKDGSEMIIWKDRESGQIDNDFWDGIVGCMAMASTLGVFDRTNQRSNASKGEKKKSRYGASPLKV